MNSATGETGRPLPDPLRISQRDGPWDSLRGDISDHGTAVLHALMEDWLPGRLPGMPLRRLLGSDWPRYRTMTHPDLAKRFAATRALLKYAAAAVLRCAPQDLELTYGPTGRPYLRGCDQIDMSLSHTEDLLLVGLTTRGLIGVDAELADRPMYASGLGRHVCTPAEMEMLESLPAESRNKELVRLWTLKEAYSKAIGQGMQFEFTQFGFTPDGKPVRVQRPDGLPGTGREWSFRSTVIKEGYRVSVAVYDAGFGVTLDTAAQTMLDEGLVAALHAALGQAA